MANTLPSTNMNLPIPIPGVDPGPDWALNINASLAIIDGHNHAPGSGVQITPSGLDINSDLSFLNNNAIVLRSSRYYPQTVVLPLATDVGCTYVLNADLYYIDTNGNNVRITQSGSVAGSQGSIAGLTSPASATYVSANSTFVWQSNANLSADMDFGSAIFRNGTANSHGLTLAPPNAMGSDYQITLPGLPGGNNTILTMNTDGSISPSMAFDGVTLVNVSGSAQVGVIGTANIGTQTITQDKLALRTVGPTVSAGGVALTAFGGTFTNSTTTPQNITNLSSTITTTGRPVMVMLTGDGFANGQSFIRFTNGGTSPGTGYVRLKNTTLGTQLVAAQYGNDSGSATGFDCNYGISVCSIDTTVGGLPGTYIYNVEVAVSSNSNLTISVQLPELIVYEI